ncbi:type I-E CRISPR-associated protein Cse1/CasA [Frankia sp. Cj5]|uniref:type I-E CRISPR-associated protein Cse1/CasA n=1 Tax=Frankia sp. Cj5 TaxID=2880978 RepID=UPI001EF64213|nr:type I-E CRISPR-associated protein Cse1/CasA [Frankia sp. Cj5]
MTSFDLVHEPWIPVIRDGHRTDVSLATAFADAAVIDGLAVDDPLEAVAVLRQVLLPVMLDALGAPRDDDEWAARWETGGRTAGDPIGRYLSDHAARFDVFHPTQPFGQVAGLRTGKDETKPISLLIPRLAAGNNVPLFSARTEDDPPALSPARAVRALLAVQCWDTAAIKSGAADDDKVKAGKTTGNPTGPVGQLGVVIPIGLTLFQTLLLNTPILPAGLRQRDAPWWRREPPTGRWASRSAQGLLDLLTWQSRRVRLVLDHGDTVPTVSRVVLTAGDRLVPLPHDLEPHTAWRRVDKPKKEDPPVRPARHQPGRSAWRGLEALLATIPTSGERMTAPSLLTQLGRLRTDDYLADDIPLQVLTVGVSYGNQSAVIEDVMVDGVPLPVAALAGGDSAVRDTILAVVGQAEKLRVAANRLGDDLRAAEHGEKIPWDKGQRLGDTLVHSFTPYVHRLLAGLQRRPDLTEQAEDAWRAIARRLAFAIAEPALAGAGPGTFLGRDPDTPFGPRLATAEASFRRALNDALGRPEDTSTASRPTTGNP